MIDNDALPSLRELLGKEDKITILVRENPEQDAMAGALSLYLSFLKAGKAVVVACPTQPIVELSSLVGIDKVFQKIEGGGRDLTIVLPYQKGRIDKISYDIENDKIHLVVKAGPDGLGFTPLDINYLKTGGDKTGLVFLVGVQNPQRDLSGLYNDEMFREAQIVNIGNIENQGIGIKFVDPGASSISEIVASILNQLGAPMDVDIAQNLMTGLTFATDNLQSEKTTPLAFETMAQLLRYGAKRRREEKKAKATIEEIQAPLDWLTPKIYKGSTLP